jgi:hypothetical protein
MGNNMKLKNFVALGLTAGIVNLAQAFPVAVSHISNVSHVSTHTAMIATHGSVRGQVVQNGNEPEPPFSVKFGVILATITGLGIAGCIYQKLLNDLENPSGTPKQEIPKTKVINNRIIDLRSIFKEIDEENVKSKKSNKI